jgi:hypothetical protein
VLIGDRKLSYSGQPVGYREKIRKDYSPIVTGGAGLGELYDKFEIRAVEQLQNLKNIVTDDKSQPKVPFSNIPVSGIIPLYSGQTTVTNNTFPSVQSKFEQIIRELNKGISCDDKMELLIATQVKNLTVLQKHI